jgi:hypothetical protein
MIAPFMTRLTRLLLPSTFNPHVSNLVVPYGPISTVDC